MTMQVGPTAVPERLWMSMIARAVPALIIAAVITCQLATRRSTSAQVGSAGRSVPCTRCVTCVVWSWPNSCS